MFTKAGSQAYYGFWLTWVIWYSKIGSYNVHGQGNLPQNSHMKHVFHLSSWSRAAADFVQCCQHSPCFLQTILQTLTPCCICDPIVQSAIQITLFIPWFCPLLCVYIYLQSASSFPSSIWCSYFHNSTWLPRSYLCWYHLAGMIAFTYSSFDVFSCIIDADNLQIVQCIAMPSFHIPLLVTAILSQCV